MAAGSHAARILNEHEPRVGEITNPGEERGLDKTSGFGNRHDPRAGLHHRRPLSLGCRVDKDVACAFCAFCAICASGLLSDLVPQTGQSSICHLLTLPVQ